MTIAQAQSPEILEINSLTEEIERRQVILPPDVRTYLNEETEKLTAKLIEEKAITEEDMAFVAEVRMWIEMPENVQEEFTSIESMNGELPEAQNRHVSLKQWIDLLHVTKAINANKEWIDKTFSFPGEGEIVAMSDFFINSFDTLIHLPDNLKCSQSLEISFCTSLRYLSDHLKVNKNLILNGCTSLTHLPDNLEVGEDIYVNGCTSLTHLPENLRFVRSLRLENCTFITHLPEELQIRGWIDLKNCPSLAYLPESLKVRGDISIVDCDALTGLPKNLSVGRNLSLSHNLQDKVKEDAERLKKEGKIKGKIKYE